jgi:hypothetical protein
VQPQPVPDSRAADTHGLPAASYGSGSAEFAELSANNARSHNNVLDVLVPISVTARHLPKIGVEVAEWTDPETGTDVCVGEPGWLLDREVECHCGRLGIVTNVRESEEGGIGAVHVSHFDVRTTLSHTHAGDQVTALLARTPRAPLGPSAHSKDGQRSQVGRESVERMPYLPLQRAAWSPPS